MCWCNPSIRTPSCGPLCVPKVKDSWEQAWLNNTDSKMIVKCQICGEIIGEIEIAYDHFVLNCKECAVQSFTDAATSGDAE